MVCPFMAFIQKSLLVIETFGDVSNELEGSSDEDFKQTFFLITFSGCLKTQLTGK